MFRGQESDSQLRIPKLRQNIGIDVNEKGSTAHVAPQITLTDKFGDDDDFVADRPFLFLIENETSYTMMFTGKVVKPEYWFSQLKAIRFKWVIKTVFIVIKSY